MALWNQISTKNLKKLNRSQLCQFAWLCGVRALPYLSARNCGFNYWREDDRQKHLYSTFYALDLVSMFFTNEAPPYAAHAAREAAFTAHAAAHAAADAYATFAAKAVAHAAHTAADAYDAPITRFAAYDSPFNAYDNACATNQKLKNILLSDIEILKSNKSDFNHDITIYGKIWSNFLEDLLATGCGYWARVYEDLFNNVFVIDEIELNRRMSIAGEFRKQGAASVGLRLEESFGEEVERLNEARIIILGDKGAGKTSIARKLIDINAEMPKENESTEGVTTTIWDFPDIDGEKNIRAHIWDFAGHSITHSAHRCFMSARCLYIYVYNGRFEHDNKPSYWLEQIRIHGGNSPVMFLINEKDDFVADIAEKTLKDDYPSIVDYYRVNIGGGDQKKLEEFRQTTMRIIRDNPAWNKQSISAAAYRIKDELQMYFEKKRTPHITREAFERIAVKHGAPSDKIEEILNDLDTLGICFYYKKDELRYSNTLVLNPDWITHGVYRIINAGSHANKYKLKVLEGAEILKDDTQYKYPSDKVVFLFSLMRAYELAYFETTDCVLIPGILPIDRPDGLPTFNNPYDRLTICFVVERVLPPNVTARIVVLRSEFDEVSNDDFLWRRGAVLKLKTGDATALIIEDERSITVRVKGKDKTAYISSLRETIKCVFESYQEIYPDLLYEVLLTEGIDYSRTSLQLAEPFATKIPMLDEDMILGCIQEEKSFFDGKKGIALEVLIRTANIYNIYNYNPEKVEINVSGGNQQIVSAQGKGISMTNTENISSGDSSVFIQGNNNAVAHQSLGTIVGSTIQLKPTVSEDSFVLMLEMLEEFLKTEQAGELKHKEIQALQVEIEEARNLGHKKGWERLRGFLQDSANISTIGTAIAMYLTAHPEIPATLSSLFTH